ncbi:MAG: hypothetical protein HY332_07845 [Chloroflexi bacterium]|nr:hypothetical protein [Chloroflexota bacterium]
MIQFATETLGWRFLLAFFLSVTLWARLTLDQNPARQDEYPSEIPVEVRGLRPNLVVANDITPVKVRISAPQESWKRLGVGSFRAVVDLTESSAELIQPAVTVDVSDPEVRVLDVMPSKVSVRIEELRTASVPVHVNQLGSLPFGYRLVRDATVVPSQVEVSGPASAVEKVKEAIVAVRLEEARATVEQTLKPEPRGPSGVVTGVRVEPQSVTVTLPVEQIAGSKAVSVVPQVRGQPAPGYWQGTISVDPSTVQVVGEPAALESVSAIDTAVVDVSGAQTDVTRTVALVRPPGIAMVRDQAATVRVSIVPLRGQQVRDTLVVVENATNDTQATVAPASASVTLSGPQPTLLRLAGEEIVATVDAANLEPGTHSLPVTVRVPGGTQVDRVVPDRVTVTIVRVAES